LISGYRRDDDDYNSRNDRPRFSEPRGSGRGYDGGRGMGGRNSMGHYDLGGDKRPNDSNFNRRSDRNPRPDRPGRDDNARYGNAALDKETSSPDRGEKNK